MVRPNQEADNRDGDAGAGDEGVSEDGFARKRRNDFTDHTHRRKNHDVHGGMRIEPEEMLKEYGVAAESGIEKAQVKYAFKADEQKRDGDNGGAQNHDKTRGVMRPSEERKAEPGHAGRAHGVDGDDKVETSENGGEPVDEDADDCRRHGGIGIHAAERGVKRPAGVQPAGAKRIQNEGTTEDVDVPTEKIYLRKGADHQGDQEIAKDGRNRGDQEKEDHGHAVHCEELVVSFRRDERPGGRQEMDANHGGEDAADEKENSNRGEVQQGDAFVIGGEQPRTDARAVGSVQIMCIRQFVVWRWRRVAHNLFVPRRRRNPGALRRDWL